MKCLEEDDVSNRPVTQPLIITAPQLPVQNLSPYISWHGKVQVIVRARLKYNGCTGLGLRMPLSLTAILKYGNSK